MVKIFEFSAKLQRMSVIVWNSESKSFTLFAKGSP